MAVDIRSLSSDTKTISGKQASLVSGTNIKTINGTSILGSGDLTVSGSGVSVDGTTLCNTSNILSVLPSCDTKWNNKQNSLVSGTSIKTVNGSTLLGSGDIVIAGGGTTYAAGNAISLASDIISVTAVCDTKWSTDTNTTYSADGTTACMTGTVLSVLPACVTVWNGKQSALVSGTSIKTINSTSMLGSGDISVQSTLVSGTNIKTINGTSILGSGDLVISGSSGTTDGTTLCTTSNVYSILPACNTKWNGKQDSLVSGTSIKTINGTSLLGSGNISVQSTLVSGTNIKTVNGNTLLGSGDIVISGGSGTETLGTAIASAATTTIGGSANSVHITGTTTITSFGTGTTGKTVKVIFDGALILTHNATSLILSTGNITTAAGDSAVFLLENGASGYWRMLSYTRKTGMALVPPTSVASATSATSSTTARCLTHAITGYSANSVTCVLTTCASIINTVSACTASWHTAAICNVTCGLCSWQVNNVHGNTSYSCIAFGLKDIQNANANLGCFVIRSDSATFTKSDGTVVNMLSSVLNGNGNTADSVQALYLYQNTNASGCITQDICVKSANNFCNKLSGSNLTCSSISCVFAGSEVTGICITDSSTSYNYNKFIDIIGKSTSATTSGNPIYVRVGACGNAGTSTSLFSFSCLGASNINLTSNSSTGASNINLTSYTSCSSFSNINILSCTWASSSKISICSMSDSNTALAGDYSSIILESSVKNSSDVKVASPRLELCVTRNSYVPVFKITGLPTSNPGIAGALWNNAGVINISAG